LESEQCSNADATAAAAAADDDDDLLGSQEDLYSVKLVKTNYTAANSQA
jgi:hypothetical protein